MVKSIALVATFAVLLFLMTTVVRARDPELTTDFVVPDGVDESKLGGGYFKHTALRGGAPAPPNGTRIGHKAVTVNEFPALNGMGVSMELVEFAPGSVNVPHIHPRASEILFVVEGSLSVGTTASRTGKVYKNVLQKGDVCLFPKGLVHYQANLDKMNKAVVIMAFGSQSAGYVDIPRNLFGSSITDEVLIKSFNVPAATIQKLRNGQNLAEQ